MARLMRWMARVAIAHFVSGTAVLPLSAKVFEVRLYDYAALPPDTKAEAIQVARRVLEQAGIFANWKAEVPPPTGTPLKPDGAAEVFIRILSKELEDRLAPPGSVFGFTLTADKGHYRWLASVFYHRAAELARDRREAAGILLGHLIAHEAGHLLLGGDAHSLTGIMRSPWGTVEMKALARARLVFSREQANRMQADVLGRLLHENIPAVRLAHIQQPQICYLHVVRCKSRGRPRLR